MRKTIYPQIKRKYYIYFIALIVNLIINVMMFWPAKNTFFGILEIVLITLFTIIAFYYALAYMVGKELQLREDAWYKTIRENQDAMVKVKKRRNKWNSSLK